MDEKEIMKSLPSVLSYDVKSDFASKVIYEISKEKPIIIKTFSEYLPEILDNDARAKISEDIAEKQERTV